MSFGIVSFIKSDISFSMGKRCSSMTAKYHQNWRVRKERRIISLKIRWLGRGCGEYLFYGRHAFQSRQYYSLLPAPIFLHQRNERDADRQVERRDGEGRSCLSLGRFCLGGVEAHPRAAERGYYLDPRGPG